MTLEMGEDSGQALEHVKATADKYLEAVTRTQTGSPDRDSWLEAAAASGRPAAEMRDACSQVNRTFGINSGRSAILLYLLEHVGESVPAAALAGVSGIGEWARRIRELRVEFGWPIESGITRDDMENDHYRLTAREPDSDLAERRQVAKDTRNLNGSGKNRLLHYLIKISPRAAEKEQQHYVAKIQEWPRRLRELEEEGWQIVSNLDDPTLPPGSYRLHSLERRPPRVRRSIKLRYEVLERDGKACCDCGSVPGDGVPLQIHHIRPVSRGGDERAENLETLCSDCHAGRHAHIGRSAQGRPTPPGPEVRSLGVKGVHPSHRPVGWSHRHFILLSLVPSTLRDHCRTPVEMG